MSLEEKCNHPRLNVIKLDQNRYEFRCNIPECEKRVSYKQLGYYIKVRGLGYDYERRDEIQPRLTELL